MAKPHRCTRAFTLVELLVVIAIIALLLAILMPVLGKASKAAKSTKCRANLNQMFKGVRLYWNNSDEYFPLAWHVGGSVTSRLGNLSYFRFALQEACVSGFHQAIIQSDLDAAGSVQAAKEEKFRNNAKFWECSDSGWTNEYFAPVLLFKWPDGTSPYDKHRQLGEITQTIPDSQRPVLTDVNAATPNDEAVDPNDSQHQSEMRNGFSYVTLSGIDVFVGVGPSLRNPANWDTTRFDFRHNDAANFLFLDSHVEGVKRTNRARLARLHRRWNSLTISERED